MFADDADLKQYLSEDLRCKLNDMYLEPSTLACSPMDPIGKGEPPFSRRLLPHLQGSLSFTLLQFWCKY